MLDAARDAALDDPPRRTCSRCKRAARRSCSLAPGFYHGAETVADLVDFVVGRGPRPARARERAASSAGARSSGGGGHACGRRGAADVRPDRAGLRRDEPRDDGGARPALAADHRAGGRRAGRPGARRLLRHRRPRGRGAQRRAARVTGLDFSPRMLERARRKAPDARRGCEGDLLALPFEDGVVRRGDGRLRRPQRRRPRARRSRELRRVLAAGGRRRRSSRSRSPRGLLAPFYRALVRPASCRCSARC